MHRPLALVVMPLLVAVGCTANALRGTAPFAGKASEPAAEAPSSGFGSVRVGVRWPSYGTQAIPLSAASLDVAILNGGTPVATASIVRPASSVTLTKLPAGAYTVQLEARRSDATLVADASASIAVLANRIAAASLVLVPKFGPRLDSIYPTTGPAGTAIALYGANFLPPPGGTYSVLVDDWPVPMSMLQSGSSTVYLTDLPSWAGNTATISISVDGLRVPASQERAFTRQVIHHLKLTPASVNLATWQSQTFTATAYSSTDDSVTVPGVAFSWSLTNQFPVPDATFGSSAFTLTDGIFRATATGSATVRVEAGGKFATASVVVDAIGTEPTPGPAPGGGAP